MRHYIWTFLIVSLSLSLFPIGTVAVLDRRLGIGIIPSDCHEALLLVHNYVTKIKFPGPIRFTRNTRDDPADLPRAFTPLGTCAISVDIEGPNKGPILYKWVSHEKNLRALIDTYISGAHPGIGSHYSLDGFQYTVLNPMTVGVHLPPCFRPAIPADLDVVQCILREYHTVPAWMLPRGPLNGGRNHLPRRTSGELASGMNPAARLGGPATPGLGRVSAARRIIQAGGPRAPAVRTGLSTEIREHRQLV